MSSDSETSSSSWEDDMASNISHRPLAVGKPDHVPGSQDLNHGNTSKSTPLTKQPPLPAMNTMGVLQSDPGHAEKIDQLYKCGVGQQIDLPQLVVVGDQSSGKSSVLAGLTKLPFARAGGICTRFPTKVISRYATTRSTSVSIISSRGSPISQYKEFAERWSGKQLEVFDSNVFQNVVKDAHKAMHLKDGSDPTANNLKAFSSDVLEIEVRSPTPLQFSVIDLPGIFHSTDSGKTEKEDIKYVKKLVMDQMKNPRSLILVIVSASADPATQEALEMAGSADPAKTRTVGVLTKPDLMPSHLEDSVTHIMRGESHSLTLGWSVVMNKGQSDTKITFEDRDTAENQFFESTAFWRSFDPGCQGITNLRHKLEKLFIRHIEMKFPAVQEDIKNRLLKEKKRLASFGEERNTAHLQRQYLLRLSEEFQDHVSWALDAKYYHGEVLKRSSDLRLATLITQRNNKFYQTLTKHGNQCTFDPLRAEDETPPEGNHSNTDEPSSDNIRSWLRPLCEESQGFSLGSFDSDLLGTAMQYQSQKWGPFAKEYINDIIQIVQKFIEKLLEHLCSDEKIRTKLLAKLRQPVSERYEKAREHVDFLFDSEARLVPTTFNRTYNKKIKEIRERRSQQGAGGAHSLSSLQQSIENLHDTLCAYYETALPRFIDNVCMQAAMYYVHSTPVFKAKPTEAAPPLRLFSMNWIFQLSDEELANIAGEDEATMAQRKAVEERIEVLKAGESILQQT